MTFTTGDFFPRVRPRHASARCYSLTAAAVVSRYPRRIGRVRRLRSPLLRRPADKLGRNIRYRKIRAIRRRDDARARIEAAFFTTRELLSRLTHLALCNLDLRARARKSNRGSTYYFQRSSYVLLDISSSSSSTSGNAKSRHVQCSEGKRHETQERNVIICTNFFIHGIICDRRTFLSFAAR